MGPLAFYAHALIGSNGGSANRPLRRNTISAGDTAQTRRAAVQVLLRPLGATPQPRRILYYNSVPLNIRQAALLVFKGVGLSVIAIPRKGLVLNRACSVPSYLSRLRHWELYITI